MDPSPNSSKKNKQDPGVFLSSVTVMLKFAEHAQETSVLIPPRECKMQHCANVSESQQPPKLF